MRRGGTTSRVSGSGSRVGGKSVASRAEMQMQYGQYGRGDTVSFVGSRLSPPRVSDFRDASSRGRGARRPGLTDTSYRAPAGMRLSCSRLLGTFRTSSSGIARPIMDMTSTWKDGTDTQRTRITASYVRHTRISGSVYDQSRVSTRASPPGASAITPKMQGSHGCPRS
jgi:hypothetical protein